MHRLGKVAKEAKPGELSCVGGGGGVEWEARLQSSLDGVDSVRIAFTGMLAPGVGTRHRRFEGGGVWVRACRATRRFVGTRQVCGHQAKPLAGLGTSAGAAGRPPGKGTFCLWKY